MPRSSKTAKHRPRKSKTYTRKHYNSNDGMLTTVWGPGTWHFLHTISFNYPIHPTSEEKHKYRNFILTLKHVLPCGKCRKNLRKNFARLPLTMSDMENRQTFSKYIYRLHELINTMLNKKSGLSYADVKERYEHFRARCSMRVSENNEILKFSEDGCTEPLFGEKAKCVLHIVPQNTKCETFQMDETCIKKRQLV